jgi:hypothetical protein
VLEQHADANTAETVWKDYHKPCSCNATCVFTDQMSKYKIGYEIAVWEITMNRAGRPYLRMLSTKIRDERV